MLNGEQEATPSGSEPQVFPFRGNSQPLMAGCSAVLILLFLIAWVFTCVNLALKGDRAGAINGALMSPIPALMFILIVWDIVRFRKSKARIELQGDVLSQFSIDGSLIASGRLGDVTAMTTSSSAYWAADYGFVVTFQDGQEIFFDERIDLCWKLEKTIKRRTGRTFEPGIVRFRPLK